MTKREELQYHAPNVDHRRQGTEEESHTPACRHRKSEGYILEEENYQNALFKIQVRSAADNEFSRE